MNCNEEKHYRIPLEYKSGEYTLEQFEKIENKDCGQMCITYFWYDGMAYEIPEYNILVDNNFYNLSLEEFERTLTAFYDINGILKRVEMEHGGRKKLVYVRFDSQHEAEQSILECAEKSIENIIVKLTEYKQISRLFMDYYSDNSTLIIKKATSQEVAEIEMYKDNSGEYSTENCMEWDDAIDVMIRCCENCNMFDTAVKFVEKYIIENLDRLDRTEDFKFISEEFD